MAEAVTGKIDNLKKAEHGVKRIAHAVLRPSLRQGRPERIPVDPTELKRVLLLRPEAKIGDMVVSMPVIEALKKNHPHIELAICCSPRNAMLVENDPRIDRVHLYTKKLMTDIGELRRIKKLNYDCIIDLLCDDSVTTLYLSQWYSKNAVRLGSGKGRFAPFYDYNASENESDHIVDKTLRLLEPLGINPTPSERIAPPYLADHNKKKAGRFLEDLKQRRPSRVIGLNISAGQKNRHWSDDNYSDLIDRLLAYDDKLVLALSCAPADRERAAKLIGNRAQRVRLLPNGMGILDVAAVIARLDLLISPDTSLVHIARSFNRPVVALISSHPKNLRLWVPYQQREGAVIARHYDDIYDITVDQVMAVFQNIIALNDGVAK